MTGWWVLWACGGGAIAPARGDAGAGFEVFGRAYTAADRFVVDDAPDDAHGAYVDLWFEPGSGDQQRLAADLAGWLSVDDVEIAAVFTDHPVARDAIALGDVRGIQVVTYDRTGWRGLPGAPDLVVDLPGRSFDVAGHEYRLFAPQGDGFVEQESLRDVVTDRGNAINVALGERAFLGPDDPPGAWYVLRCGPSDLPEMVGNVAAWDRDLSGALAAEGVDVSGPWDPPRR